MQKKEKKSQRILNDQAILTQVYSTLKVKEVETILNGLFNYCEESVLFVHSLIQMSTHSK